MRRERSKGKRGETRKRVKKNKEQETQRVAGGSTCNLVLESKVSSTKANTWKNVFEGIKNEIIRNEKTVSKKGATWKTGIKGGEGVMTRTVYWRRVLRT